LGEGEEEEDKKLIKFLFRGKREKEECNVLLKSLSHGRRGTRK